MNNVVSPFGNLAAAWRGIQTGRASLDRLGELLDAPAEDLGAASEPWASAPAPALSLRDVHFGYSAEQPVLHGLSGDLPGGALTAIVGPNGSGKSTLAKLLLRFYAPDAGAITWDGRPLREIPVGHLRSQIAYLPQEPFLIDASVADNLRLGAPGATEADLARVLSQAGLPADGGFLGLEVGERGKRLSGGQRLRLSLATAEGCARAERAAFTSAAARAASACLHPGASAARSPLTASRLRLPASRPCTSASARADSCSGHPPGGPAPPQGEPRPRPLPPCHREEPL